MIIEYEIEDLRRTGLGTSCASVLRTDRICDHRKNAIIAAQFSFGLAALNLLGSAGEPPTGSRLVRVAVLRTQIKEIKKPPVRWLFYF